ncbi:gliding motility lipoprotein GldH [Flavobacterium sp. '19STA2R22 D10 B1']|uniref:gliding motility lipoprotein GldH n=1 Tax=Flavobacterium aerium TaxID=3037261 RepID=UPI00278BE70D|nr:gliding motility lipoprotein GldH [Flavobacterium sp. '19STA2R22 D10 B1']
MTLKNSVLLLMVTVLFFSCDKKRVFDEYKTIGKVWNKDSIVSFKFKQEDTTSVYNLFVNLRNNDAYPFNNLFLIVSLEQPDGFTEVDTLEYQMAKPDGSLLGSGFSDVKESKLWFKEKQKFPIKGDYQVHIQQAVRQTGKVAGVKDLEGVTEVGFRIESIE